MSVISLSWIDLSLATFLVMLLALLTYRLTLDQHKQLVIAAARTIVQLLLVGLVLNTVFSNASWHWVLLMMTFMLLVAGYEVSARQNRKFQGWWGYGLGVGSMFISSFSVLLFALLIVVQPEPWYQPQYAIPLLGMLFGNSMTGISLAVDRLTDTVWKQRAQVEAQLMLGRTPDESIASIRRMAMRAGLTPIINAMSAAGVVSLPGMMTGQILGGTPPMEAVKYQILIMLLITLACGLGAVVAVSIASKRLFDDRARLSLERLSPANHR